MGNHFVQTIDPAAFLEYNLRVVRGSHKPDDAADQEQRSGDQRQRDRGGLGVVDDHQTDHDERKAREMKQMQRFAQQRDG